MKNAFIKVVHNGEVLEYRVHLVIVLNYCIRLYAIGNAKSTRSADKSDFVYIVLAENMTSGYNGMISMLSRCSER
jgi:hypothetical protein